MADKLSYIQIVEQIQHVEFLKDTPNIEDEDRSRLEQCLIDLASRQENKFDNIIGVIKHCDSHITALENELEEIKASIDHWKRQRNMLTNIIKFAYQQKFIGNKPTGVKYQGVFRKVKPKLVDNFDKWEESDRLEFGLRKVTTVTRISDGTVLEVKEEDLPDKERLREVLTADTGTAPAPAHLIQNYSFTYERRKRLIAD